uniref:Uncharacterized protein n=1 Tax=Anas platyrhynchos platyrhynchos TaxID=8840 RepID=A0A493TZC9_ANAPP
SLPASCPPPSLPAAAAAAAPWRPPAPSPPALASKTKTKKKHFVAQKVKLFRASDPLLMKQYECVDQMPFFLLQRIYRAHQKACASYG